MPFTSYSTPLIALDAVVLDTETTDLDARSARLLQIGAVKIRGTKIDEASQFERLVNPGTAIPRVTTDIHGITDAMVTHAPRFAEMFSEFKGFAGGSIVIGHTIGYDLAVLKRECELAGISWRAPRSLDVRVLARAAVPTLAHYTLDQLCEWLKIENKARHTAMGDAMATAKVFAALLPLLRQRDIRTLAEAEAAVRALTELDAYSTGGLVAAVPSPDAELSHPLARIESFAYRHRVGEVMTGPPVELARTMQVRSAIQTLIEKKVSSVYVAGADGVDGIVTERDVLRAIGDHGADALELPLERVMSAPLHSVGVDEFVYRAIGRMDNLGLRHLGVHDHSGRIIGAITTRDLMRLRASAAILMGDKIDSANDAGTLGAAWATLPMMARQLLAEDVDPRTVAAVVSTEIRALTARAAEIAEARMIAAGRGAAPVRYGLLVLGSAGRGESLLAADQDNAIVYESGAAGGEADQWFEALGHHIANILDEVGVPYCKGGVMAKNALWRHSLSDWHAQVEGWVRRTDPQDLLNVDIFFDAVTVHGDSSLGDALLQHARDVARRTPVFIRLLSEPAREWHSPFTLFGGIKTDHNSRIDLKRSGLMPIFTSARVLAMKVGSSARSTPDRLRAYAQSGAGSAEEIEALIAAHRTILGAMLSQQLTDIEQGIPPSSRVDPKLLGAAGRAELKEALERVKSAVDLVGEGML